MVSFNKRMKSGLTFAEIIMVLIVMAVVATATITVTKAKAEYYLNKFMYYSAYFNLKEGMSQIIDDHSNIPTTGATLCAYMSDLYNTVGTVDCSRSGTTSFISSKINFSVTNGFKFFNLAANPSTVGSSDVYTIYIDIDGNKDIKEPSKLNSDVFSFYVKVSDGTVLPNPNETPATDRNYLSASVKYLDASMNYVRIVNDTNFKNAFCSYKGYYTGSTCTAEELATYNAYCSSSSGHICELTINKPRYYLFAL